MNLSEIVSILEEIVKAPTYYVIGAIGKYLIYASDEQGILDLWSLNVVTYERTKLTEGGIHSAATPRNGVSVAVYTVDVSGGREIQEIKAITPTGEKVKLPKHPLTRVFGIAYDNEKIVYTGSTEKEVALYSIWFTGEVEKLTTLNALAFVTDVDGKYIVGYGDLHGNPRSSELFIYDIESKEMRIYTPKKGSVNKAPKIMGSKVLFETNAFGKEGELVIYDVESESIVKPEFKFEDYDKFAPVEHSNYGWTYDGRVWAIGKRNGVTKIFIDGKEIPTPEGYVSNIALVNGKIYFAHSSLKEPYRIFEVDVKTRKLKVVVDNSISAKVREKFGNVSFIKYRSFDGLEIPAYIIESLAGRKPGPTVVYVHGGPWWEVPNKWDVFIASLVATGFHVIAPNFRGSTGYGEKFRLMDIGDPGGGDLEDVVYAAKYVKEKGIASKVAIMGYSYGGFMMFLATVKKPDAWCCGVAGAGITDWEEMYELSDAIFKKFIETLFNNRKELLKERSAITYVDNLKVPLCIIHPQNDSRTPLKPVLKYVSKLLEKNKSFELHVIPNIGHVIRKVSDIAKIVLPSIVFLKEKMC